jgi:hypothetical protein
LRPNLKLPSVAARLTRVVNSVTSLVLIKVLLSIICVVNIPCRLAGHLAAALLQVCYLSEEHLEPTGLLSLWMSLNRPFS